MRMLLWLAPVVAMMCIGWNDDPGPPPGPGQAEVWLGASVDKIKGFEWPRDKGGRLPALAGEPRPHQITIHFPSGRRFTGWSKYLLLSQHKGMVTEVTIAPLADYVGFRQAVAAAEKEAQKVRFQDPWDLFERLTKWGKLKQPPEVSMAGTGIVEERVTLFIQVNREENKGDPVWWATLDFSYWLDKKTWDHFYGKP
jgi:hypothetical protein